MVEVVADQEAFVQQMWQGGGLTEGKVVPTTVSSWYDSGVRLAPLSDVESEYDDDAAQTEAAQSDRATRTAVEPAAPTATAAQSTVGLEGRERFRTLRIRFQRDALPNPWQHPGLQGSKGQDGSPQLVPVLMNLLRQRGTAVRSGSKASNAEPPAGEDQEHSAQPGA